MTAFRCTYQKPCCGGWSFSTLTLGSNSGLTDCSASFHARRTDSRTCGLAAAVCNRRILCKGPYNLRLRFVIIPNSTVASYSYSSLPKLNPLSEPRLCIQERNGKNFSFSSRHTLDSGSPRPFMFLTRPLSPVGRLTVLTPSLSLYSINGIVSSVFHRKAPRAHGGSTDLKRIGTSTMKVVDEICANFRSRWVPYPAN